MRPQTHQFKTAPVAFDSRSSAFSDESKGSFSGLLRKARSRTGLTFRAAHQLTRVIARIMGSPEYTIGLGLLSDYEAMNRLPRHIAKIISLCIVYCLDIRQLLEAAGVYIDDSSKMPLPHVRFSIPSLPLAYRTRWTARNNTKLSAWEAAGSGLLRNFACPMQKLAPDSLLISSATALDTRKHARNSFRTNFLFINPHELRISGR